MYTCTFVRYLPRGFKLIFLLIKHWRPLVHIYTHTHQKTILHLTYTPWFFYTYPFVGDGDKLEIIFHVLMQIFFLLLLSRYIISRKSWQVQCNFLLQVPTLFHCFTWVWGSFQRLGFLSSYQMHGAIEIFLSRCYLMVVFFCFLFKYMNKQHKELIGKIP